MLVCVSPAKSLDWSARPEITTTTPDFLGHAFELVQTARGLTPDDLKKLMKISDGLAKLNYERFRDYDAHPTEDLTRPAAMAFSGDTYKGLEADTLDADDLRWAQSHLRILSGLYGVLRPLDAIQPYRLEMGSRLQNMRGKNLYAYWGDTISKAFNAQAADTNSTALVNCASQEYFGAVDVNALTLDVITPQFFEVKNGQPKIVSFYAKRARGAMARYIVQNRLSDVDDLKSFDTGGYAFNPDLSTDDKPAFVRHNI